ncbi:glycoside hydrolase family protein [Pontiella agarivorans]|uniref:Glycoside hydrolase family protein n=1 Tax=Pontiella agarivorans TaxID=3038953 RepID=A0ABU5MTY9_9BACT|nr:glycoside hydrolase family protein [Pontiella agarivorans]MDZ8117556.1 glycoside hydrolase family protein [Pontiella agarivorans]
MKNKLILGLLCGAALGGASRANVTLVGSDIPNRSVMDGDFESFRANWRWPEPSSDWVVEIVKGGGRAGFAERSMMINGPLEATFESRVLDHTAVKSLNKEDVLHWRFSSNTEYPCDGRVTLALVFGDDERVVASRVKVPNGPDEPKTYEGFYTLTAADARQGMPRLKFTLESTHGIIVYVHWVDLKLLKSEPVQLAANAVAEGIELSWNRPVFSSGVTIYRSENERAGFTKVAEDIEGTHWTDSSIINGREYFYVLKRGDAVAEISSVRKIDSVPPAAPLDLKAFGEDWVVNLYWKTNDRDIAFYRVYRDTGDGLQCIAQHVGGEHFEDMLPEKGAENRYAVKAVDHSGNEGPFSGIVSAHVKAVRGASFSDLILKMPIHKQLRNDVWGADNVRPRDPDNGIEDSFWSYWGGKAIEENGKYHLNVVRWQEGHRKGHWAWPESTVAYAVSDHPAGPYEVVRDRSYDYKKGLGHNANIIPLNDGTYAMYALVDWKPTIFTSVSMAGPWKLLGEMKVNVPANYKNAYRLQRNLSGVQCDDGSFLFVTKAGAMIRSTQGILGPYDVVSGITQENETIPQKYRHSNYEDPTMWYDGVQYHMMINAFLDYRAVYLRSPDGIHWKYEDGLAYTPTCTVYEDGTRTFWYKVERPNVIQDEYGRATHLQLAAIDVPKADDYGNDRHSSKHLIIPLTVYKRLTMLNKEPVNAETKEVRVLMHSEEGFDARTDLDFKSLRFGASEAVNFGGGAKLKRTLKHKDGLILIFGEGNEISDKNFVGKLIGQTKESKLVVGYSKLVSE